MSNPEGFSVVENEIQCQRCHSFLETEKWIVLILFFAVLAFWGGNRWGHRAADRWWEGHGTNLGIVWDASGPAISTATTAKVNELDLHYWYMEFNRKYFNSNLPKEMPVSFDKSLENDGDWGQYDCALKIIKINTKLDGGDKLTEATLLHEMVHVELCQKFGVHYAYNGDDHGSSFKAEMRRLADMGAFDDLW